MIVILAMMGVSCAYFLANYVIVQRRLLKSITALQAGTRVIGSGNLDFGIQEKKNDEIGELSRAFNQMTANLKGVTASKTDLEREIAERQQADEALENLMRNAWKFTARRPSDGRIAKIEFGETHVDGKPVYFVRDNGAGFNVAYADKLFAPFLRLHKDEDFPGTGIGLAPIQRIIHRHGGKVWAEGEVNRGATFYFTVGSDGK